MAQNIYTAVPFFTPATEALRFLPECPRVLQNFPGTRRKLGWVGIQHGTQSVEGSINLLDLESLTNQTIPLPGRPGFFAETRSPGIVVIGLERRLVLFDLTTGEVQRVLVDVTADDRVIINDGVAVPGGVLFGTKDLRFDQAIAALYYYDVSTGELRTLFGGQTCSNGKIISPNPGGFSLIDIDSTPKTIYRYQLDTSFQSIVRQSLIAPPETLPGFPDGMRAISQNGSESESALVAFYNPAPVSTGIARQISLTDGSVLCEWRIPGSPRVTCPEFAEIDGKVKAIFTTAVEGMSSEVRAIAPGAGGFYIADTPPSFRVPAPPPLLDVKC